MRRKKRRRTAAGLAPRVMRGGWGEGPYSRVVVYELHIEAGISPGQTSTPAHQCTVRWYTGLHVLASISLLVNWYFGIGVLE